MEISESRSQNRRKRRYRQADITENKEYLSKKLKTCCNSYISREDFTTNHVKASGDLRGSHISADLRIAGVPSPAVITNQTAPVHIDVGGTTYTSTLSTLTKYPDSRLGKLFNGEIDITLDTLKQHYFIDRDGPSFRHILNFLRHNELIIPSDYQELNILQAEANYYGLNSLVDKIERVKSISSTCS